MIKLPYEILDIIASKTSIRTAFDLYMCYGMPTVMTFTIRNLLEKNNMCMCPMCDNILEYIINKKSDGIWNGIRQVLVGGLSKMWFHAKGEKGCELVCDILTEKEWFSLTKGMTIEDLLYIYCHSNFNTKIANVIRNSHIDDEHFKTKPFELMLLFKSGRITREEYKTKIGYACTCYFYAAKDINILTCEYGHNILSSLENDDIEMTCKMTYNVYLDYVNGWHEKKNYQQLRYALEWMDNSENMSNDDILEMCSTYHGKSNLACCILKGLYRSSACSEKILNIINKVYKYVNVSMELKKEKPWFSPKSLGACFAGHIGKDGISQILNCSDREIVPQRFIATISNHDRGSNIYLVSSNIIMQQEDIFGNVDNEIQRIKEGKGPSKLIKIYFNEKENCGCVIEGLETYLALIKLGYTHVFAACQKHFSYSDDFDNVELCWGIVTIMATILVRHMNKNYTHFNMCTQTQHPIDIKMSACKINNSMKSEKMILKCNMCTTEKGKFILKAKFKDWRNIILSVCYVPHRKNESGILIHNILKKKKIFVCDIDDLERIFKENISNLMSMISWYNEKS